MAVTAILKKIRNNRVKDLDWLKRVGLTIAVRGSIPAAILRVETIGAHLFTCQWEHPKVRSHICELTEERTLSAVLWPQVLLQTLLRQKSSPCS